MPFKKYQHLERFGATETQGIEFGECYIFPKIDGTNASLWWENGSLQAGSRTRHLTLESDNAGFYAWALKQECFTNYFASNPNHRLFGEWLVPHSLKTYRSEAWQNFYVFDVAVESDTIELPEYHVYLHYEDYKPLLESAGVSYIPPVAIITNGTYDHFINQLRNNVFLIEDGKGQGEGIVIKRYDYRNKYGRTTWAKIVTSEFKEKHAKEMGCPELKGAIQIESEIAQSFVTKALVDKEFAKIENESGWSSKSIPRLLNTVYYCIVKEDGWEIVKKYKNPTIDYKRLQHYVVQQVKQTKPEIF